MAGGAGACAGEARSVALETAYVHDVYEEISGASSTNCSSRAWPKVAQFLHDLEPGALVCDVGEGLGRGEEHGRVCHRRGVEVHNGVCPGCGNGKYLSINPAVFKIGADRCLSLTELARENQHEVSPSPGDHSSPPGATRRPGPRHGFRRLFVGARGPC
ncbi:hypothetical protein ONE63_008973 [Megalurothrips usitatus]|uniref:Uncharacterized protein n=1 Tax=Megalurothrips usitatus TaxID=439358 RepID=A0AAV7XKW4_9NEOP|nr:hypothetical protein ONE63_008973 [Megalurothrips usitatus]